MVNFEHCKFTDLTTSEQNFITDKSDCHTNIHCGKNFTILKKTPNLNKNLFEYQMYFLETLLSF